MTTNNIFEKLADRWKDVDYMESESDIPEIKKCVIQAKTLYNIIKQIPDLSITSAIINSSPNLTSQFKTAYNSTFLAITDESWLSLFSYEELDSTPNKFQEAVLYGLIEGKYTYYKHGQYIQNVSKNYLLVERDRDQVYIENIRLKINNATYTTDINTNCVLYLI
jgi:hypothetical protein